VTPDPAAPVLVPADTAEDAYENAPCGYVSTAPDGLVTKVNRTFLALTGYRREDLVGLRRLRDLLTPGGRVYYETHLAPLLQMQGAVREIAVDVVCADGRRLPMLLNAVLDRDVLGAPRAVRAVLVDATDRRSYERELLRRRREAEVTTARMRALQGLTAALAAPLDPPQIAEVVAAELTAHLDATGAGLALVDPDTGRLVPVGPTPGRTGSRVADAVRAAVPLYSDAPGTGRAAAFPLTVGDRIVGALWLEFPPGPEFDADGREVLLTVARQCAQALERARLLAEAAEAARRSARLADVSRSLDEVRSLSARGRRLVDNLVPDLADRAVVELSAGADVVRLAGAPVAAVVEGAVADRTGTPPVVAPARPVTAALTTGEPQLVTEVGPAGTDLPLRGEPVRSYVVLPLRTRGRVLGALTLASTTERRYRQRDLPFLTDLAYRAALALENVWVFEQERDVAHTLQHSMLAGEPPADPRFDVTTFYRSAVENLEVGGDWYDTFGVSPGVLGVVVGDVVGRGVLAASAMGQLRSAIRALAGTGIGPAAVLRQLDTYVELVEAAAMATVVYGEIDLATGQMRYAAAGHLPPLLVHSGAEPELLWDGRSAPLGVAAGLPPRTEAEVALAPGARLLLYTDGLVERRRQTIVTGLQRLADEAGARRGQELPVMVQGLTEAMMADADRPDDVCLLALAYRG
jgi:serine/threonine-protein kinase RsbW